MKSELVLVMAVLVGCGSSSSNGAADAPPATPDASPDASTTVTVRPGDNVQAALINAKSGQTILFSEGTYMFADELTLSVPGVTVKGKGDRDKIILDFSQSVVGGHGISVTAGDFVLDGITIRDTKDDSVRVQGADPQHLLKNVTIRNVKVYFSAGSTKDNPGYAIYPTTAENVLIENCEVHGASDAGIYVGQSKNIMVRNNLVSENENGIEIENSTGAEVMGNTATNNVSGILVFNLPNLPTTSGSLTVVHDNMITANNHDKFAAEGSGVGAVTPPGAGVWVLAVDKTEIRNNVIKDNKSSAVVVVGCQTVALLVGDPQYCTKTPGYDPYPEGTYIHDNTITNNGTMPLDLFIAFANASGHLEDIMWDGLVDASKTDPNGDNKLCIQNGAATFLQADPTKIGVPQSIRVSTDITPHDCSHPAVPSINVTW